MHQCSECEKPARPRHSLCHTCAKRRQRRSRRRMPRYTSPWDRLAAAALRYAQAEAAEEYERAECVLRKAALNYRIRERPKEAGQLPLL